MKTKIFTLFTALCCMCTVYASNVITYTAGAKLPETTTSTLYGLHANAFNVAISSHTFSAGQGTITFADEVASIGERAFYDCSGLTSVTIPNSVTSIGDWAFFCCSGLTSVTIPNSVTSIGSSAFACCSGLTSVTIPNSVTSIGSSAFAYCSGLTSVTIPNSVISIGDYAFQDCSGLTAVEIPNSVTEIGYAAFHRCDNLNYREYDNGLYLGNDEKPNLVLIKVKDKNVTSFTLHPDTKSIEGHSAFEGCQNLTSLIWNAQNCSVGEEWAYAVAPQITSFVIGDSVKVLSGYLCYRMSISSLVIPNSVDSIGALAFYGCENLKTIKFRGNFKLGERGCYLVQCYALDTVIAPAALFDMEEFYWSQSPKNMSYIEVVSGELTDDALGMIARSYKTLKTLDLGQATNTTLSDEAFKDYYNLETLVLPAHLEHIGYMAVAGCKSLKTITIPASVTEIDNSAFENCRSIKSITFAGVAPSPVSGRQNAPAATSALKKIGNWAFYNCHELENLKIPEGCEEIGDAAFYGCTYLEDLSLPSSVRQLGDNCFALCSKLKQITVKSVVPPAIEAKTFYDVNRNIPVLVPEASLRDYQNNQYWREFIHLQSENQTTAVKAVTIAGLYTENGRVVCENAQDPHIYTLTGVDVTTQNGHLQGVYIVCVGSQVQKVVVK